MTLSMVETNSGKEAKLAWVIAEKDIRLYYAKPPILMSGILLPFVLFLTWSVGRNQPMSALVPGLVAITVFFTASSVGPVIIPWEKTARTFERLSDWRRSRSRPYLLGKTLAGMIFGMGVALVALLIGRARIRRAGNRLDFCSPSVCRWPQAPVPRWAFCSPRFPSAI